MTINRSEFYYERVYWQLLFKGWRMSAIKLEDAVPTKYVSAVDQMLFERHGWALLTETTAVRL